MGRPPISTIGLGRSVVSSLMPGAETAGENNCFHPMGSPAAMCPLYGTLGGDYLVAAVITECQSAAFFRLPWIQSIEVGGGVTGSAGTPPRKENFLLPRKL